MTPENKRRAANVLLAAIALTVLAAVGFKKNLNLKGINALESEHFVIYYDSLGGAALADILGKPAEAVYRDWTGFLEGIM